MDPMEVPFTITEAPGIDDPSSAEVTTPVTSLVCARIICIPANKRKTSKNTVFIDYRFRIYNSTKPISINRTDCILSIYAMLQRVNELKRGKNCMDHGVNAVRPMKQSVHHH
jgi:hypothetical protein